MNKRKKVFSIILAITIIFSIIAVFNYKIAETEQSNKMSMESSSNSLKLNDMFSVTLIGEFNTPEDAIQGRIEYSDDVEIAGEKYYTYEEFSDPTKVNCNSQVALGANNAIGFAIVRNTEENGNRNTATGVQKIITFSFKVKSSSEKNVEIKWKGKNKDGLYDIASITIPRSDVVNQNENNDDIINDNSNNNSNNNGNNITNNENNNSKAPENVNSESKQSTNQITNTEQKNKKIIPQTGENYIFLVLGIIIPVAFITIHKIYKKNKF